jgi:hypothetical protein
VGDQRREPSFISNHKCLSQSLQTDLDAVRISRKDGGQWLARPHSLPRFGWNDKADGRIDLLLDGAAAASQLDYGLPYPPGLHLDNYPIAGRPKDLHFSRLG